MKGRSQIGGGWEGQSRIETGGGWVRVQLRVETGEGW